MSSNRKPKSSFRKSFRMGLDRILKPTQSQDASHEPLPPLASSARSPSPGLTSQLDVNQGPIPAAEPISTSEPAPGHILAPSSVLVSGTGLTITPAPAPRSAQRAPATTGAWAGLEKSLRALHSSTQLFPPVQSTIGIFIDCLDLMQQLSQNHAEREELASELTAVSELMAKYPQQSSSGQMSEAVARVVRGLEEQVKIVESRRNRGVGWRFLEADAEDEQLNICYRRIGSLFRQLQADASLSIWSLINDQMTHTRLEGLAPAKLANYDSKLSTSISRRTCTPNTRTTILSGLDDWSCDPDAADLYWMNGMAGTGKTTIACTFAESLAQRKQLAASFFCTRTSPECRDATRILPTIAYQLARYSVPFQSELCKALDKEPDASSKNIRKQFEQLIKEPLLKAKEAIAGDLVVIIDALDECDDIREVELLLSIILKNAADVPIKFFVTSRPEPEIYYRMKTRHPTRTVLHLHEVEKSLVQADIELYLAAELQSISPMPSQIQELAQRSGALFIYAATLVRYICSHGSRSDPRRRLASVLSAKTVSVKQYSQVDSLYTAVLRAALDDPDLDDEEKANLRQVLNTVICAQEPVPIDTLTQLAGLSEETETLVALEPLRAVLHFSETSGLVSTLHASFPDFMFDSTRSGAFSCNLANQNMNLAQRCFVVMESQLRFNICGLESSYVLDSEVQNLDNRVGQVISPTLWYACRYWAGHLKQNNYSDSLCALLGDFLANRLLFWLEVLNLKRQIGLVQDVLWRGKQWLVAGHKTGNSDLARQIEDARNFAMSFAANSVSQCTPHLYISSLAFCPKSSFVFKQYYKKTAGLVDVVGSAMKRAEAGALASWQVNSSVQAIAYSPDGTRIISGSDDGTTRVWNAQDGTLVAGPLQGHIRSVNSVACSPDGTRIVSGSDDKTIRVWDAQDGTHVAGPLQGHTESVNSVAYSPNGACIVSGSGDMTVRVWNVQDGTPVPGLIQGHTGSVNSVAYSPDGARIVSGSDDETIRVWDAQYGTLAAGPLRGHTWPVSSVAYSPNGTRIVSGSDDRTVRVWNAQDGTLVAGPFRGHTLLVKSVAYSPDGTRIVSGSEDKTIRVWGAQDGTLVAGPLQGHTNAVRSVAYSPDGTRIVSGSEDKTIRVWNSQDGTPVVGRLQGHTESVTSVAYSPNGARIVSGSGDEAVRVWNAQDGMLVLGPLQGHTGSVRSVAFSPDSACIVSSSDDETIQVWNAQDGTRIAGPLQGHTGSVRSVTYSPDGTRIVSGSDDKTIRVWDAQNGMLLLGPLQGHTGPVRSVAFSPDGTRIVSGSGDKTIRVWKAQDGALVAGPLRGHTRSIVSVAYSPDSTHIASGSSDTTIRVWKAQGGTLVAGPLQGHTWPVSSVAYSPDGTRIASGSQDKTIRVWDAQYGTLVAGPLWGHTWWVSSVAYSPDGTRIVSGSEDKTIRVWDAHPAPLPTGASSGRDLRGDTALFAQTDESGFDGVTAAGWVLGSNYQLLFWMPYELQFAPISPTSRCTLVLGRVGSLVLRHENLFLGEHWARCFQT